MALSIDQMLSVTYTTKVVSQVAASSNTVMKRFGMQGGPPGSNIRGANVRTVGHRKFSYDIFNDTRKVGASTAPGQAAAVSKRQAVGVVYGQFPRMHDSIELNAEEIHNRRQIGGSSSVFDEQGATYVARQQRYLGQLAGNFRSMLVGGMIRGQLFAHQTSDRVYYDFTATLANWTIDWQIPAANKTQLNMLAAGNIIDVSWDNPGANIPNHILQINAAFQQLQGSRLDLMIMNAKTWNFMQNNDYVIQNAGSSNPAYIVLNRNDEVMENGKPNTTLEVRIAAVPFVTILVTDEGLDLGNTDGTTTYTKFIPDNCVWFGPNPDPDIMEMLEGDEPIAEYPNAAWVTKAGLSSWSYNSFNPTTKQIFALDNAVPALYVPASTAYGTCIF